MSRSSPIFARTGQIALDALFCLMACGLLRCGVAQTGEEHPGSAVRGYITSIESAARFDVNKKRVVTTPETVFSFSVPTPGADTSSARAAIQPGAHVLINGVPGQEAHTVRALSVTVEDDSNRNLSGAAVIASLSRS